MFKKQFPTSKFKGSLGLTVTRLNILKNQRDNRCIKAKRDIVEYLKKGMEDHALKQVENLIKDQNMLEAYLAIERFCYSLINRVRLIENDRTCLDELKEALMSVIYASSRCGELEELANVCAILKAWYGKVLVANSTKPRNSSGVNAKLIERLSADQPTEEIKKNVIKELCSEYNIKPIYPVGVEKVNSNTRSQPTDSDVQWGNRTRTEAGNETTESTKPKKYKNKIAEAHKLIKAAATIVQEAMEEETEDGSDDDFNTGEGSETANGESSQRPSYTSTTEKKSMQQYQESIPEAMGGYQETPMMSPDIQGESSKVKQEYPKEFDSDLDSDELPEEEYADSSEEEKYLDEELKSLETITDNSEFDRRTESALAKIIHLDSLDHEERISGSHHRQGLASGKDNIIEAVNEHESEDDFERMKLNEETPKNWVDSTCQKFDRQNPFERQNADKNSPRAWGKGVSVRTKR